MSRHVTVAGWRTSIQWSRGLVVSSCRPPQAPYVSRRVSIYASTGYMNGWIEAEQRFGIRIRMGSEEDVEVM